MKKFLGIILIVTVLVTNMFAGVIVSAEEEPVNLARQNTVTASYHGVQYNGTSYPYTNGIDGKKDNFVFIKKSGAEPYPWYMVDLGIPCQLTEILLTTRNHSDGDMKKINIEAANKADFSDAVILKEIASLYRGTTDSTPVSEETKYRFVRLRCTADTTLVFAELEVMGYHQIPEPTLTKALYYKSVSEAVVLERVVPKGLDHIELNFSTALEEETVTPQTLKLLRNDSEMPVQYTVSGDTYVDGKIAISFTEGLNADDTLELVGSGITDVFDNTLEFSKSFTVGGEDFGRGSVEVSEVAQAEDNELDVIISGTALSSQNVGISNRTLNLYVKNPSGTETGEPVATTVSGEDGKYELKYTFGENDDNGEYVFYVECEYAEERASAPYVFMNATLEKEVLESLKNKSASEVKTIFDEYDTRLGIKSVEDREVIEDYSKFYAHFENKETAYPSKEDLRHAYEEYVALEIVNQAASSDAVAEYLLNNDNCKYLKIDTERMSLLTEKDDLVQDIFDLDTYAEVEDFALAANFLIEKHIALECGKADVEFVENDLEIYDGQGAEIELSFLNEQEDVKSVIIEITSENEDLFEDFDISISKNNTYELADNVLTINVAPDKVLASLKKLGTVTFTVAKGSDDYELSIKGRVYYEVEKNEQKIVIYKDITSSTATVDFKKKPSGGSDNVVSSRPSGGKNNVTVKEPEQKEPEVPDVPEEKPKNTFSDTEGVAWAKEAIDKLVEKGIISESADGKFYPDRPVTREEFVKMIVVAMGIYDENAVADFKDVDNSKWYYPYIASAYKANVIGGVGDNYFGTGRNISREDMAVIIMRAANMGAQSDMLQSFADNDEIADYAKEAVYTLKAYGIINGVSETEFAPKNIATRAMSAKIVFEMLNKTEVEK